MEVYKLYKELLNRAAALVCVAGMPQSGKSTYIRELIAKLANADAMTFLQFSLAKETDYTCRWFEDVFESKCKSKIIIDDTPAIDIEDIINLSKKENPNIIIIDYFELITDKAGGQTRVDELNSIANKLKGLSKELSVPIILEVQMSTYLAKGHDKLSIEDLRCAGDIGEIADLIIFTEKEEVKDDLENIVPSIHARNVLHGKYIFTDFEKASLIWNHPLTTRVDKLNALEELADSTANQTLRKQISARIRYEDAAFKSFIENDKCNYIYVVFDEERTASGYLSSYELARQFGIDMCKEYEMKCFSIEKQFFFGKSEYTAEEKYDGRECASCSFNARGELKSFYSNEVRSRVNVNDNVRFESRFFKIPPVVEAGTVARIIGEDTLVVTEDSNSDWKLYMEQADEDYYDFSDIQMVVHELCDDGTLSHHHVNPLYLEPLWEEECKDKKEELRLKTLSIIAKYFENRTMENDRKVLEACKEFANYNLEKHKRVFNAKSILDVRG